MLEVVIVGCGKNTENVLAPLEETDPRKITYELYSERVDTRCIIHSIKLGRGKGSKVGKTLYGISAAISVIYSH